MTSSSARRQNEMLRRLRHRDYRWVPAPLIDFWTRSEIPLLESIFESEAISRAELDLGRRRKRSFVRELNNAGAGLLLGTDAPVNTVIPGLGVHDEARNLARAGLSPAEVLRVATWNAALALGAEDELGSVEVGKRADLILLRRNPLNSVRNLAALRGVMVDGGWSTRQEVRAMWRDAVDNYPDVDFTAAVRAGVH